MLATLAETITATTSLIGALVAGIVLIMQRVEAWQRRRDAAEAKERARIDREAAEERAALDRKASEQRSEKVKAEIAKVAEAADTNAKEVKQAVAVVAEKTEATALNQEKKINAVHELVNGGQLPSLRTIADQARVISTQAQVIATATGQNSDVAPTEARAVAAEANLADHVSKIEAEKNTPCP